MEAKLFNKWSFEGIKVEDPGLQRYVSLQPVIIPKTGAHYVGARFHKSDTNIIERFVNKIMVAGHKGKKHFISSGKRTGKAANALEIMKKTMEIIEERTKKNPILVVVKALENAAPREEIITIEYGGARYPKAVECAPQRRIDVAIRLMVQGSFQKAFNKGKKAYETLAAELINAYNLSNQSTAISKKLEMERQSDSSR
ncbi:30S ribosomal protein S7 [Candidatus Woesearchaeota archaeon]|nr:30S ribosomal protein S7 [Candidatus Woesearchaeota archaeon]MBW3013944.1 30S ribosomal protein S7 [Candidatus Woesearchaeota archaeon]